MIELVFNLYHFGITVTRSLLNALSHVARYLRRFCVDSVIAILGSGVELGALVRELRPSMCVGVDTRDDVVEAVKAGDWSTLKSLDQNRGRRRKPDVDADTAKQLLAYVKHHCILEVGQIEVVSWLYETFDLAYVSDTYAPDAPKEYGVLDGSAINAGYLLAINPNPRRVVNVEHVVTWQLAGYKLVLYQRR